MASGRSNPARPPDGNRGDRERDDNLDRDSDSQFYTPEPDVSQSDFARGAQRGNHQAYLHGDSDTPSSQSPIKTESGGPSRGIMSGSKFKSRRSKKRKEQPQRPTKLTWQNKVRDRIGWLYQIIVIQFILRRKPLPPSKDGRQIPLNPDTVGNKGLIDERSGKPYISNFIRSSRYTLLTFIPAQLIYQFSKLGNFYFLVVGSIQMIPGLSTVGRWTTIAPLGVFVALSMAKEGYDDWRRYTLDKVENRSPAWVLKHGVRQNPKNRPRKMTGKGWKKGTASEDEKKLADLERNVGLKLDADDWLKVQWQHVQVGDIVRLHRNDGIPADMALLYATGPSGIAYIDTMALDGETNLKSKQACPLFAEQCSTVEGLKTFKATVVSEDPNIDLYSYDGKAVAGDEIRPLTMNNVVYRGSTLRNTSMAIGIVINSGEECKIRMNANKNHRAKKPRLQSQVNKMILIQILGLCSLSAGLTAGYVLWQDSTERKAFYLRNAAVRYVEIFFGYVIMFNTLIPLSLYISLEIVKVGQYFMMLDTEMYDPITDTPAVINTTSILENLGQVDYVFSDKTGTLTDNIMKFRKLSVAGVACLHDMDVDKDEEIKLQKIEAAARKRRAGKAIEVISDTLGNLMADREWKLAKKEKKEKKQTSLALQRTSTGISMADWSTPRPDQEPEMKTDDLLDLIQRKPNTSFARKARFFLLCIALCHTCLPERMDDGKLAFQAANPDELALVEAARDLGMILIDRPTNAIKLETVDVDGTKHVESYEVLDVVEFSSKRKRMSIIVRMPDGRICVICKGADNVIRERLRLRHLADQKAANVVSKANERRYSQQSKARHSMDGNASPRSSFALNRRTSSNAVDTWKQNVARKSVEINRLSRAGEDFGEPSPYEYTDSRRPGLNKFGRMRSYDSADQLADDSVATTDSATFEKCFQHVDDFATEGLRTLLYGFRYIEQNEYTEWKKIHHEAETSLVNRQDRIEEASDLLERKFDLAGATAIEDKLQDGVPDTIDKLRRAHIKVWMLTGDKRETAINIGHSAQLCKSFSQIYVLDRDVGDLLENVANTIKELEQGDIPHAVLVVDGGTLETIDSQPDLALLFYDLVILVDSVICCRASPSQKAALVKTIRRYVPRSLTLAIGDGANDIGMILEAHVGIGVSGREGLQAARISDYAIAQFRFLQKLLFVHGRWNYLRTGRYALATFWKEILFYLIQAHYQRFNGYSGTSLFEQWTLTVFNVLFTSLAVIIPGIFDKDLSAKTLLQYPELYTFGQRNQGFNFWMYLWWALQGVIGSAIIFYPTWGFYLVMPDTQDTGIYAMGTGPFTVAVIFINVKLM